MNASRPKLAFWFRYGPAEQSALCHAIPGIIEQLAQTAEIHYFSMRSRKSAPDAVRQHAVLHELPFQVERTRERDKFWKTLLWLSLLPWLGLYCQLKGISVIYMDETLPLSTLAARVFYRGKLVITVADFFADIYLDRTALARAMARGIRRADLWSWRRLPLLFTRALNTRTFLIEQGVEAGRIVPIYNPCDFRIYHPGDRQRCRQRFGFADDELVLMHHGILHPNKGNDRILRALAQVREQLPRLRFVLVGDGPEMPRLRALSRELGLDDRVTFTGWLPTLADVNEILNAADIGLVMRVGHRSDDFHVTDTLVHNMACGLPVLAARLGGVAEVVREGENGALFDPNDMDEFIAKLKELSQSPERRAQLGRQALADAQRAFSLEDHVQKTAAALHNLLPTPKPIEP